MQPQEEDIKTSLSCKAAFSHSFKHFLQLAYIASYAILSLPSSDTIKQTIDSLPSILKRVRRIY
jgi:hypothetical protein